MTPFIPLAMASALLIKILGSEITILVSKYSSHSSLFFFFDDLTVFICIYVNIKLHLYRTSLLA